MIAIAHLRGHVTEWTTCDYNTLQRLQRGDSATVVQSHPCICNKNVHDSYGAKRGVYVNVILMTVRAIDTNIPSNEGISLRWKSVTMRARNRKKKKTGPERTKKWKFHANEVFLQSNCL